MPQHPFQSIFSKKVYMLATYLCRWLLLCSIIGVSVGSLSAVFLFSLVWVGKIQTTQSWLIYLLPLAGLAIGWIYHKWGQSVSAGNNLVISEIEVPKQTIPFRMGPLVYIGTLMTHLFGGSAGREGTAIQMASSLCDQISKPLKLSDQERRILLIAAMAAGFGSVFGTPLTGAVFALELVFIGKLRYKALLPTILAAFLAHYVAIFWKAPHTHYHIEVVPDLSALNLLYALIAGIAFGLCAALFSKGMHFTGHIFKRTIAYPPLRPFVGGLIVAIIVTLLGTNKYSGLGISTIVSSFTETLAYYDFFLKMLLTIITLSAGFKGGEVTPLFFIGACLGNTLALYIPLPLGLLAGMGFVAVFAGATNTPIACSIMAIELFGLECGVYTAIACGIAYLCSGSLGIYSEQTVLMPKHKRYLPIRDRGFKNL